MITALHNILCILYDYSKSTKIVHLTISTSLGLYLKTGKWKIKMMMIYHRKIREVLNKADELLIIRRQIEWYN
jgi:hypothetical protein